MSNLATFRISTTDGITKYAVMTWFYDGSGMRTPYADEWRRVQVLIPNAWRYTYERNGR